MTAGQIRVDVKLRIERRFEKGATCSLRYIELFSLPSDEGVGRTTLRARPL